jgi:hypothetical protein
MKGGFSPTLLAIALLLVAAKAQTLEVTREEAAYHPDEVLDPATLMSQQNFDDAARRGYVVVEGFIDYHATTWPEDDGDYHFEMQTTDKQHEHNPIDGLVCEIDPGLQLEGSEALRDIDPDDRSTYRKARVFGWLRFGTETNHAGVQDYDIGNGKIVSGHWEIHPVERVETIDNRNPIKLGPTAKYVKPPRQGKGSEAKRFKLTDDDVAKETGHLRGSNYARLIGNVKRIKESPTGSGGLDVDFEVNSDIYTATIPQYYIDSFNAETQTVKFVHLPNFASIKDSLKPSDENTRTFYGLRNWTFHDGEMIPTLAPVEMIK